MTIYRKDDSSASSGRIFVTAILAALVLAGFSSASIIQPAHAGAITPEEHWRYNVHWYWDPEERESVGLITPTIVIENRTLDRLEGYVADANGTRLDMYDGEQVVKVRYGYDGSMVTDWELASWIHDGYFAIDIPEKHKNADFIGLYIGNNSYTIDDGDVNTRNSLVSINSIRTDFRLGSTPIPADETSSAEIESVAGKMPMPGSLIDQILAMFGML